jgi:hypothetical protein
MTLINGLDIVVTPGSLRAIDVACIPSSPGPAARWPYVSPPPQPDCWHSPQRGASSAPQLLGLNALNLWPVVLPGMALQQVQIEVTAASAAGGLLRAGLYGHDSALFRPNLGGLIQDWGAQASDTVGAKLYATTATIAEGVYWVALVAQVATCSVRATNVGAFPTNLLPGESPGTVNTRNSFQMTGVSGALPTGGTLATAGLSDPRVFFRRSAAV